MGETKDMCYLLDGYNLLHAMGLLRGRAGPTGLEKARLGLLGLLRAVYGEEATVVTVVFDAAHAPPGVPQEEDYQGIHVRFAVQQEQADDLIEALIRHDSAPRRLTVVSDDHRIRDAAERRRCKVSSCAEYLEWLERHRRERGRSARQADAKPEHVSQEESQHWLREFASLQNDPGLKELSDPPEFFDEVETNGTSSES
jgi:predicted RNA-binding protein with PIN domain